MVTPKKVSAIDAKILIDLLKDGRKSFSEIAKEYGTTKSIIWKHYKEMKKAGIIIGATIQMNHECFGYNAFGNIQFKVEPQLMEQVMESIQKMPNMDYVWRIGKSSFISVVASLTTLNELDRVKGTIGRLPSVSGIVTNIWTGIRNIPENLSLIPLEEKAHKTGTQRKKVTDSIRKAKCKIDEIDVQIVEKLARNGRLSFRKLAEDIHSSTKTVARRYEKLKRNGIIKVSIQINPVKIGYRAAAGFNITLSAQNRLSTIVETIAKIPDVTMIIKTSGVHDLFASALIKDIDKLMDIQDEIASVEGVTSVEIFVSRIFNMWPLPREYISTF